MAAVRMKSARQRRRTGVIEFVANQPLGSAELVASRRRDVRRPPLITLLAGEQPAVVGVVHHKR